MARSRTVHRCSDCGSVSARWVGRCPGCGEWNTLVEEASGAHSSGGGASRGATTLAARDPGATPTPLADIDPANAIAWPTGLTELDRVLGGGLVSGSVTLLGGEPGIGKSTLLLQVLGRLAAAGNRCLLVSAEESAQQVRVRAERLGALAPELWILAETSLPPALAALASVKPDYLVVDSIQTVFDPDLESAPGSVTQVRGCAHQLVQIAKQRGIVTVLVGHVTKEGSLAGPRVLEHVVDTVLTFEGDRDHGLRLLRAVKHRFGPTGELGLMEMGEDGLVAVPDASGMFLGDRRDGIPGSVVVPSIAGQRPLLVELQALVVPTSFAVPRYSASGLDQGRVALLAAVLDRRADLKIEKCDVYASAVGGVRVTEPAGDLALALALASAATGVAVPSDVVASGEVGLGGEVRQVGHADRRLREAARLGFRRAIVPRTAPDPPEGLAVTRVATLAEAVSALGLR